MHGAGIPTTSSRYWAVASWSTAWAALFPAAPPPTTGRALPCQWGQALLTPFSPSPSLAPAAMTWSASNWHKPVRALQTLCTAALPWRAVIVIKSTSACALTCLLSYCSSVSFWCPHSLWLLPVVPMARCDQPMHMQVTCATWTSLTSWTCCMHISPAIAPHHVL